MLLRRLATSLVLVRPSSGRLFAAQGRAALLHRPSRMLSSDGMPDQKNVDDSRKETKEEDKSANNRQADHDGSSSSSSSMPPDLPHVFRSGEWTYETTPTDHKVFYSAKKLLIPSIIFAIAVGFSAFHWIFEEIKGSGPFRSSFRAITTDPTLIEALGSPHLPEAKKKKKKKKTDP